MLISVVIPAHNRPELLRETAASVAQQRYLDYEVVVVDDGSKPALARAPLEALIGDRLTFLRHGSTRGISAAKNAGVRAARGDVILLLDDDDLLAPHALSTIQSAFRDHPDLDCLFMGVEPFGPYADSPARNRLRAINRLLDRARPVEQGGLLFFERTLFDELIGCVPIDFQRPAARRSAWDRVGGFDEGALFAEPSWAVRAAAACRVALTVTPLTRWRIHGSNFGWPPDMAPREIVRRNIQNGLMMAQGLEQEFRSGSHADSARRHRRVVAHLAEQHLAMARHLREEGVGAGLPHIVKCLRLDPSPANLRAALIYLAPPQWAARIRRTRTSTTTSSTLE